MNKIFDDIEEIRKITANILEDNINDYIEQKKDIIDKIKIEIQDAAKGGFNTVKIIPEYYLTNEDKEYIPIMLKKEGYGCDIDDYRILISW